MTYREETEGDGDAGGKTSEVGIPKSSSGEIRKATNAKKQPPAEKPEVVWLRTKIILSFWAVIVFLGLPVWWKTTSIYRARLPTQKMLAWSEETVCAVTPRHQNYC
jgi:GPI-anchor transamidase subunit S